MQVVHAARKFNRDRLYSDVDWSDFNEVVEAFRDRLSDWYIRPGQLLIDPTGHPDLEGHMGFPTAALACLLIDTLSQYVYGAKSSNGKLFKRFLRDEIPTLADALPAPIGPTAGYVLPPGCTDVPDALYKLRCGMLHEAHVPLYCAVSRMRNVVRFSTHFTTKDDGTPMLTVLFDPKRVFETVCDYFDAYVDRLLDNDPLNDQLRQRFKDKFSWSFGIVLA